MPPKPVPTKIRQLRGNPGKRAINRREPTPPKVPKVPNAPRHLNKAGQAEWRRMFGVLQSMGVLSQIDLAAFEIYCALYGRWVEAESLVKVEGYTITTASGNVIQNPNLGVANRALAELRKFLIEFGLTPSSRSRLTVDKAQEEDPMAQFLARRAA